MKKEVPMPVIIAAIAVVVVVLGVVGYRTIVQPRPAVVPGGVHVSPPNFNTFPSNHSAPSTAGQGQ
jgi:hypothetical protein